MKELKIAEDVVPIAKFKGEAARWFRKIAETGQPVVITLNGRPAGVLLSPEEFDRLAERQRFVESVAAGLEDVETGRVHTTAAVRKRLAKRIRKP